MSAPALSAIDLGWPVDVVALVPALDELGYRRFWVTEHHSPRQSASPAVLLGMVGALSQHLRIGSAGVLLNLAAPLRVAEDFFLLESFFPGRVDLGVAKGSAAPGDVVATAILDGRPWPDEGTFARKLSALCALARRQAPPAGAATVPDPRHVGPDSGRSPALWTCGISRATARLAARHGTGLSFSDYFFAGLGSAAVGTGPAVVDAYLQDFRPAVPGARAEFTVACYGLCAETEARARGAWSTYFAGERAVPSFVGTPEQCFDQLSRIAERYRAAELVVHCAASELELRLDSYRLLAERFALRAVPAAAAAAS